jgi:hypothetical protein
MRTDVRWIGEDVFGQRVQARDGRVGKGKRIDRVNNGPARSFLDEDALRQQRVTT